MPPVLACSCGVGPRAHWCGQTKLLGFRIRPSSPFRLVEKPVWIYVSDSDTPRYHCIRQSVSLWFSSHTGILIYANFTINKPAFLPQNTRSDWIEIGMDLVNNKYTRVNAHWKVTTTKDTVINKVKSLLPSLLLIQLTVTAARAAIHQAQLGLCYCFHSTLGLFSCSGLPMDRTVTSSSHTYVCWCF